MGVDASSSFVEEEERKNGMRAIDGSRVVMREKSSQSIWSEEQHRIESLRKDGVDDTLRFSPSDKLTLEYLSSTLPCVEGTRLIYMLSISHVVSYPWAHMCNTLYFVFIMYCPSAYIYYKAYSVLRSMNPSQTSVGGPSPTVSLKSKP